MENATGTSVIVTRAIVAGNVYRHFKGGLYYVLGVGEHTETGEKFVIYHKLPVGGDGPTKVWVRPLDMFLSQVDHAKYPYAGQDFRFVRLAEDLKCTADIVEMVNEVCGH